MTFARVVAESGLTKIELGVLYGVSRQSIHTWCATPPRAGSLLARQAQAITDAILVLVANRRLPLGAMDKAARRDGITKLAATLQNLKPAPAK